MPSKHRFVGRSIVLPKAENLIGNTFVVKGRMSHGISTRFVSAASAASR